MAGIFLWDVQKKNGVIHQGLSQWELNNFFVNFPNSRLERTIVIDFFILGVHRGKTLKKKKLKMVMKFCQEKTKQTNKQTNKQKEKTKETGRGHYIAT